MIKIIYIKNYSNISFGHTNIFIVVTMLLLTHIFSYIFVKTNILEKIWQIIMSSKYFRKKGQFVSHIAEKFCIFSNKHTKKLTELFYVSSTTISKHSTQFYGQNILLFFWSLTKKEWVVTLDQLTKTPKQNVAS